MNELDNVKSMKRGMGQSWKYAQIPINKILEPEKQTQVSKYCDTTTTGANRNVTMTRAYSLVYSPSLQNTTFISDNNI
jgi:hypothetical protein